MGRSMDYEDPWTMGAGVLCMDGSLFFLAHYDGFRCKIQNFKSITSKKNLICIEY